MMINRRHCLAAAGGALAGWAGLSAAPLRAQSAFPSRSFTLMVAQPAGTPSDSNARRLQPYLQKAMGQTVIVENVAGAGGTLGAARVMQQPADGHTLFVASPTELVLSPLTVPAARYTAEDFAMVGNFGRIPYVLVSRTSLPQGSLADILALAGKGGAPLSMGNIGAGSLIHLLSLDFERIAGLNLNHVPYRGIAPMVQDLMSGQLDLCFTPLAGNTMALLEQGRMRTLAVSSIAKARLLPQVPTLAASDTRFARFDYEVWGGIFLRRETPEPVQARLHAWWSETARDPEFLGWMRSTGGDPLPVPPLAETRAFYSSEVARYRALLKAFPEAARG
jgi:tripartite-type tricarboxylate transporter receptor subunit TctC